LSQSHDLNFEDEGESHQPLEAKSRLEHWRRRPNLISHMKWSLPSKLDLIFQSQANRTWIWWSIDKSFALDFGEASVNRLNWWSINQSSKLEFDKALTNPSNLNLVKHRWNLRTWIWWIINEIFELDFGEALTKSPNLSLVKHWRIS